MSRLYGCGPEEGFACRCHILGRFSNSKRNLGKFLVIFTRATGVKMLGLLTTCGVRIIWLVSFDKIKYNEEGLTDEIGI